MKPRVRLRILVASLLGAVVALPAPAAAERTNLMDLLFGNRPKPQRLQVIRPAPRRDAVTKPRSQKTAKRAPASDRDPQGSVPSSRYYTYKPDAVGKADFSSLASRTVSLETTGATAPGLAFGDNALFAAAAPQLAGFEPAAEKAIAKAVVERYRAHPQFIWVSGYGVNGKAEAALKVMADADAHGLAAADYAVTPPSAGWSTDDTAGRLRDLIRFEMLMSLRAVRYALDARNGVVVPNRMSGYHDIGNAAMKPAEALDLIASADDPAALLAGMHPQMPEYVALKTELASLRSQTGGEPDIVLPDTVLIKPGESHDALAQIVKAIERRGSETLRATHGATLAAYAGAPAYDEPLVAMVRDFQSENGLKPDGVVGPRTLTRLTTVSRTSKIERVALAMEALRWHPETFGPRHVIINQPAFQATYVEDNVDKLTMRVVVGTKANQTYFFHDEIETVVFNPYWGVPQSIIVNEMAPKGRRDPGYFERNGYEVVAPNGKTVSPYAVNWHGIGRSSSYGIRQKPGSGNALGELKILFPNAHDIYMHDTPQKALFDREERAFSHGCVRLHDPRAMAAAVLGTTVEDVERRLGQGNNKTVALPERIPVYVSYFTAFPDSSGTVHYYADMYERDVHLKKALAATAAARGPQG